MELHPACGSIQFLLGTWRGEGKGHYPTIDDFVYGEEVVFSHSGRPFLRYEQRTWSLDDDSPMHTESGYWRPKDQGRLEIVLAQPSASPRSKKEPSSATASRSKARTSRRPRARRRSRA